MVEEPGRSGKNVGLMPVEDLKNKLFEVSSAICACSAGSASEEWA